MTIMDKLKLLLASSAVRRLLSAEIRGQMRTILAIVIARYGVAELGPEFEREWGDLMNLVVEIGVAIVLTAPISVWTMVRAWRTAKKIEHKEVAIEVARALPEGVSRATVEETATLIVKEADKAGVPPEIVSVTQIPKAD